MEKLIDFLNSHIIEVLFSGLGTAIVAGLFIKNKSSKRTSIILKQKNAKGSSGSQIGIVNYGKNDDR